MILSCWRSVVTVFTRLLIIQSFYTSSLCFFFPRPTLKKWRSKSLRQYESNLAYTRRHWGSLSVFFQKVQNQNTEEPKYQAKALTVETYTIKQNRLTAGAAVVVTIPSLFYGGLMWIILLFFSFVHKMRYKLGEGRNSCYPWGILRNTKGKLVIS